MDFMQISEEELRKNLVGKKILIKENLKVIPCNHVGLTFDMKDTQGQIITIRQIEKQSFRDFLVIWVEENGSVYEDNMIEAIVDDKIEEDNDETLQIKKGDLVKIKQEDKQKEEIATRKIGTMYGVPIIRLNSFKIKNNSELPKKEFIVADIIDNTILPYYLDDKYKNIVITKGMVELVEEGYVQRIEKKKSKTQKEKNILENLEIIEEMKSKVNIKDFKKIYAGSLRTKPNDLKGIDLLLHQWAFNKKHLYKLLGKELSITKEIEYQKGEEDMKGERETLCRELPAVIYILEGLTNTEILNNKLENPYTKKWCKYANGDYCTGTKVSKILNDAFKNDRLNTVYSDIVAQSKIRGVLEISINPIEILLMSTNVSGWQSCHRINDMQSNKSWGAWSGGIFSYMCDDTSMIAFRHNNKLYDFKIYNSKTQQHSKNWRQMIWISKDFTKFITSRQYPGKMEEIAKQIREMLEEQINHYTEEFTWVHSDDQSKLREEINDYKCNSRTDNILHYNDMLHGFSGDLCYKKGIELKGNSIKVGSNPVCPLCGKKILKNRGIPFCSDCRSTVNKL